MPGRLRQERPDVPRWRAWLLYAVIAGWSAVCVPAALAAQSVTVVLSGGGAPYSEVSGAIGSYLRESARHRPALHVQRLPGDASAPPSIPSDTTLLVTVGTRATAWALERPPGIPVLAVLIPRKTYLRLLELHADHGEGSAIFLDQPAERRVNLMSLLLPGIQDVALLRHPSNADSIERLERLLQSRGYRVHVGDITSEARLIPVLEDLLEESNVLFATPDPAIYNRNTIKPILLTAYRYQVPIIGFSHAYVRAGALAATYSTASQIGRQAAKWIDRYLGGAPLPPPAHPQYFSVSVNRQVARTQGLDPLPEHRLLELLQQMEAPSP